MNKADWKHLTTDIIIPAVILLLIILAVIKQYNDNIIQNTKIITIKQNN